jgi:hypothetical protein
MDRLRHTPRDWRRAAARANDALWADASKAPTVDGPVPHGDMSAAELETQPCVRPGPFDTCRLGTCEAVCLLALTRCGAGLNGLSCTYLADHRSELHSWERQARLPQYRRVGGEA